MHKQPTLTKQWKYNIFVQILYNSFRYAGRLFFGCDLFVARCNNIRHSCETMKERKYRVSEKIYRKICVRDINFLTALPPLYVILCCFLRLLPSPGQVTYLLSGPYGWCSVWWYNEWTVENMKISCNLILAGWQPKEHDIILDFVLASVVLVLTLHNLQKSHTLNCYFYVST